MHLAQMYLAGVGGSSKAVSRSRAAEAAVDRGSSEVCVATLHFAGRGGALSAVKKLTASGAGNSATVLLVDVNITYSYNETTYGEQTSYLIKNTKQQWTALPSWCPASVVRRTSE